MVSTEWQSLMWSTCHQLTLVLYSLSKYDDCLHFTRLALQLEPENSESWYIYVEIQEKLQNEREGYKSWLNHRTIPDNNSSIIARQIQHKQSSIRSLEDKKNDEVHQRERKYLQLDVKALQYFAQQKR
ncbi:hypothetical protein LOTGIDRAFT_232271 [Lottia gigantea]|uniref:Tetratricopeptide repeat protein 27 n=1 Tax=Lottia gigantea TaxID=225164 RepID=V4AMM0_LOTGI|nr:hypothetical protein LOTGIDRAFT_232271 [Lottia gigantea]ESO94841.1 hypothetical protein LOTGIDRAFT_232271 [Lottia gigantea]